MVIDKEGIIVVGDTRYKAAKRLKLKEAPCVIADDLTAEQIEAYRLADNRVGEIAEWDIGLLNIEMGNIVTIDMGRFGFEEEEDGEKPVELEKVILSPYRKVHYLISLDINDNDRVADIIDSLRDMEGIEVDSTLN